jgi:hypothetical protein
MRTLTSGYRRAGLILTVIVGLVACESCRSDRQTESFLETHSQELVDLTVPVDSSSLVRGSVQRTTFSEKLSWEFDTKMSGAEYADWLKGKLRDRFRTTKTADSPLQFFKNLDNDTEAISVQLLPSGDHLHVHVDVNISPD